MAYSKDKLTPSDAAKLAELEKQLAKEKTLSASANKEQTSSIGNKSIEKQVTKSVDKAIKETDYKSSKSTSPSTPRKPASESKGKAGVLWFFTMINLLMLIVIIAAGYWAWLQWQSQNQQQTKVLAAQQTSLDQQQSHLEQQQKNVTQSIASNQLAKGDLEQQNQALQISIQSLIEQFQLTSAQVQTNQNNLADVSGRRPADWVLAEAD
jgi:uroporphyrin-3 C-methyltransferase